MVTHLRQVSLEFLNNNHSLLCCMQGVDELTETHVNILVVSCTCRCICAMLIFPYEYSNISLLFIGLVYSMFGSFYPTSQDAS